MNTSTSLQVNSQDLHHIHMYMNNGEWSLWFDFGYNLQEHRYDTYYHVYPVDKRYVNAVAELLLGRCEVLVIMLGGEPSITYDLTGIIDHREYVMNKLFEIADDLKGVSNG